MWLVIFLLGSTDISVILGLGPVCLTWVLTRSAESPAQLPIHWIRIYRLTMSPVQAGHQRLTPVILATQEEEIMRIAVRSQPGQIVRETLSWKNPTQNRAGRVAQVVEHLPSKHKTLSSKHITPQPQKCSQFIRMNINVRSIGLHLCLE
jgi:hypothetical protein